MQTSKGAGLRLSSKLAASCSAILGLAAGFAPAQQAAAQQQQPAQKQLEEIVVTGSRIVRRDNSSNSPIVTIESDAFQAQMGLNFEAYLNQLPEYNPAASPTTSQGDVQITPVNSVGIASISLRGFGPNRSLVLVNGKRIVPINALMVTDVNAIPSALIQRVETITGGASAVYGADAVGGVTNFILRDNFQGAEVDMQYGASDAGDGAERRISAVFGLNANDGKANLAFGVETYNRDAALAVNHSAYTDRYSDPHAPGYFAFLQGTSNYNCLFNCPTAAAVNGVFGTYAGGSQAGKNVFSPLSGNFFRQFDFNSNGSVFVENSAAGIAKYSGGPNFTFYPFQMFDASIPGNTTEMTGKKWENSKQLISSPQERYSLFATGHYDITDNMTLYARANMAESETRTSLFGTNAIFGWEATVPYLPSVDSPLLPSLNYNDPAVVAAAIANPTNALYANPGFKATGTAGAQHPVPVQLAALLNSRAPGTYCLLGAAGCGAPGTYSTNIASLVGQATTGDWLPGWNPDNSLPPRSTVNTNTQWQVEAGLNFKVGQTWKGEFYLSHGQSSAYNNANGNLSLTRYRVLIRQPDWGRNATIQGNTAGSIPGFPGGQSSGFGAASVHCTSGFNDTLFKGDAALSTDCFNAVNATLQTRAQNKQDVAELNFEGVLANMKSGELRAAFGYQKRQNSATFVPDILQSESSFTDQVIGVYPTGYLDAKTQADDIYAEMLIPLLANKRGARRLELELGARTSDYDALSDKQNTWKALVNWEVNDWLRFRGGFNRATRAPNIGELFLNTQEIFVIGGNNYGDPCGLRSTSPIGAGGTSADPVMNPGELPTSLAAGQTATGAASARRICEALMGTTAANQFYNVADAPAGGGGVFNWVNQVGNSALKSETADTWTWGVVMSPKFKKPLLANMTFTLDTYRIKIDNAIMLYSVDYANFRCFGAVTATNAAEAAAQAASPACQLLPRNQALGGPLTTTVSYDNQAWIKTSGADVAFNWRAQFADLGWKIKGGLGLSLQANILDSYRTKQSPAVYDVATEWKGSLGPDLSGTNGGAYEHRLFSTVSYFRDTWNVSLRWRGLPEVWSAAHASQEAIKQNNARVAAGGPGIVLAYVPGTLTPGGAAASPEIQTKAYRLFDLAFSWDIKPKMSLRGGINNLLDTDPPEVQSTTGYPVGTNLAGVCGGAPGCVQPGTFVEPYTGGFNGGYYDVLGRRYFVGFDVRF
jgi:iron complex outermembrane recepter protein